MRLSPTLHSTRCPSVRRNRRCKPMSMLKAVLLIHSTWAKSRRSSPNPFMSASANQLILECVRGVIVQLQDIEAKEGRLLHGFWGVA